MRTRLLVSVLVVGLFPSAARAETRCGYFDGTTPLVEASAAWTLGPGGAVLKNGTPFHNSWAARLFVKNGVIYGDNTDWGIDPPYYVMGHTGWEYLNGPFPTCAGATGPCGFYDGSTPLIEKPGSWSLSADGAVMKNDTHYHGTWAAALFVKDGVIYGNNTDWGIDPPYYVMGQLGWEYLNGQFPTCARSALAPPPTEPVAVAGGPFKVAFWNMQYGSGIGPRGDGICTYGSDYGDSGANRANAWNTGHQPGYLDAYVKNDPEVIAYAAAEVNSATIRPATVAAHLWGWSYAGDNTADGTSLYARHGFKDTPVEGILPVCGWTTMYFVYGKAFRTAAAAAANSDDYVNVVAVHFLHSDSGTCGSSDAQGAFLRNWLQANASNGRPTVVVGDLNVIVEEAVDQRIQYFQPYGPGTTFWYQDSLFPWHMANWNSAGFIDAWRALHPLPASGSARTQVLAERPGFTSTWGGGPYYGPLWKRIDYALVKGASVVDMQLFAHVPDTVSDPYTGLPRQNATDCKVSDHAGLVVSVE